MLSAYECKTNLPIMGQIKNLIESNDKICDVDNYRLGLCGLYNLGNTCFMNTILQCLRHTTLLNRYLLNPKVFRIVMKNSQNDTSIEFNCKIALLCQYMKIMVDLWENKSGYVIPSQFSSLLSKTICCGRFSDGDQHDAHEFMINILDIFHEVLSRNVTYKITGIVINDYDRHIQKAHEAWASHYKNRHSAILDIFSGQLQTRTICPNCHIVSFKYDPSMAFDISIPSMVDGVLSIYQCLDNYIKPEQLSEDNMYNCDHCKQKHKACQIRAIWTLPNILIIKFNRFKHKLTPLGYQVNKITTYIDYPLINLDLAKYISSPITGQSKYDLYAVANHTGNAHGGHYYACCYSEIKNKWYQYNDISTSEISNMDSIITQNAYMLFYKRRD